MARPGASTQVTARSRRAVTCGLAQSAPMRSFVGLSIFGVFGLLIVGYSIWEGAWLGIVAGLALVAVDVLYWLMQPVKRR